MLTGGIIEHMFRLKYEFLIIWHIYTDVITYWISYLIYIKERDIIKIVYPVYNINIYLANLC